MGKMMCPSLHHWSIYSKTFILRDAEQGGQVKETRVVSLIFLPTGGSPGIQLPRFLG